MFKLIAVLSCLILCSCGKKKIETPSLPYVTVSKVDVKDMPLYLEYVGHVEANQIVNLKAQVAGMLNGQYFIEGQAVKAGDLLLTIDDRPFLASLAQAEGDLSQNVAKLKQAEDTRDRYAQLIQDNFISQLDYDQFVTNVYSLEGAVQQSYASVATAKINLGYCTIASPIDGVTSKLLINVGNYIPVGGQALLTLNQIMPIKVQFNVPEKDLPRIAAANLKEPLKVIAFVQGQPVEGQLSLIDNQVDINTGTLLIEAMFPNDDEQLWPGQFVDVRLILDIKKNAITVPTQAVFVGQDGFYVYVVKSSSLNNDEVELRQVILSQREDKEILIEKGLNPNEVVVLDGQINLKPGTQVTIQPQKNE